MKTPPMTQPITLAEAIDYLDNRAEALHHGIDKRARDMGKVTTENDRIIHRDLMKEDIREQALLEFVIARLKPPAWQVMVNSPKGDWILLKHTSGSKCIGKWVEDQRIGYVDQDGRALANLVGWMPVPE